MVKSERAVMIDMTAWTFSAPPAPRRSSRSVPAQPKSRASQPTQVGTLLQNRASRLGSKESASSAEGYAKSSISATASQRRASSGDRPNVAPAKSISPSGNEVLVYLDVDGVLNTHAGRASKQHLESELLSNLRRIMDSVPGAAILLSSSWRHEPQLVEALEAKLAESGIAPPVGKTGDVPLPRAPPQGWSRNERGVEAHLRRLAIQRSTEILKSTSARRPLAWVAIDDLDLFQTSPDGKSRALAAEHFIHTVDSSGLTEELTDCAIALLLAQLK